MIRKWFSGFHKQLNDSLTEAGFLKELGITKKDMTEILQKTEFTARLKSFCENKNVTCAGTAELCQPVIALLGDTPAEGWLSYCFSWGKHLYYPENFPDNTKPQYESGRKIFLTVLRQCLTMEEKIYGHDPLLHIDLESPQTIKTKEREEYTRFYQTMKDIYFVEFMRIGAEITPFNTLGHIAGVYHIATHMARQLDALGEEVDLGLTAAAAVGHDIGKFGCRDAEARRVPYLHYYYTDQFLRRYHMPVIGNIAANHSTWDLELENLSAESLLLIYADFRVKSTRGADGQEIIHFYTLKDSFDVILGKLDNVDEAKRNRYCRVYAKLADFEKYMTSVGVNTDPYAFSSERLPRKDSALLAGDEIVDAYKRMAFEHNIHLMHILNHEESFGNILESARSDKNWKNIRSYLDIFDEYCTYINQHQKQLTISFLYELLIHREGDIRIRSAHLLGEFIVDYDIEYRKEIPQGLSLLKQDSSSLELFEKYTNALLYSHHKLMDQHRLLLISTIPDFFESVVQNARPSRKGLYLDRIMQLYHDHTWPDEIAQSLLKAGCRLPLHDITVTELKQLLDFIHHYALNCDANLQLNALSLLNYVLTEVPISDDIADKSRQILEVIPNSYVISSSFMKYQILMKLHEKQEIIQKYEDAFTENVINESFLENLKTATSGVCKEINMEFLLFMTYAKKNTQPVHTTTHLANMLMGSEQGEVRRKAGRILASIAKHISIDQCNEVVFELMKGLELGDSEYTKYIPDYLGEMVWLLDPEEIDECLQSLEHLLINGSASAMTLTLDTLAVMLQTYPLYVKKGTEAEEICTARQHRILQMLLRGLSGTDAAVSQEAVYLLGEYIFGSDTLSLQEKEAIFRFCGKKILHILQNHEGNSLSFFIQAASLNDMYRFISEYLYNYEAFHLEAYGKAAFFPGTFDPFSLGHKGIVSKMRRMGFEVYLSIDEFSWSKKAQPRLIRREMVSLSTADDEGVFMFPDDLSVNIANENDLRKLRSLFPTKDVYMVVGSDVVDNASAYKKALGKDTIHTFNHIVFRRNKDMEETGAKLYPSITGEVVEVTLPPQLESISSTSIRESIDMNRDISKLVDPAVQKYIYSHSLYLREPQYKTILRAGMLYSEYYDKLDRALYKELKASLFTSASERQEFRSLFYAYSRCRLVVLRDEKIDNSPVAAAIYRTITSEELMDEFGSVEISDKIRSQASGKAALLIGMYSLPATFSNDYAQLVASETFSTMLEQGYTYCLYRCRHHQQQEQKLQAVLARFGMIPLLDNEDRASVYAVNMHSVTALMANMKMVLKEPFNTNPKVLAVLNQASIRFQQAVAELRPGELTLAMDSGLMNRKLVNMITKENGVPNYPTNPRVLGPHMCVPFGKMFRGMVAPNTVTKVLHTEKVYSKDFGQFDVVQFPGYSSLPIQIRAIKSFMRDVVLIDDVLHSGYRLSKVNPLLRNEQVTVRKILVGILSGHGMDMAKSMGVSAESAYYIPNMNTWFCESTMYPFIGGDSIEGGGISDSGLITSINMILPYAAPNFLIKDDPMAGYQLSMVCLQNTRDILKVLEEEYQYEFSRNLTLDRLSEAIIAPTCPDKGLHMNYEATLPASAYIENDIQRLVRLRKLFHRK